MERRVFCVELCGTEAASSRRAMGRLRAGESFPVQEESRRRVLVPVQKKATTARASDSDAGARKKSKGSGSPGAAMPPAPPSRVQPKRAAAAAAAAGDVTLVNTHVLDCGVCFSPLKPPIFQQLASQYSVVKHTFNLSAGKFPCIMKLTMEGSKVAILSLVILGCFTITAYSRNIDQNDRNVVTCKCGQTTCKAGIFSPIAKAICFCCNDNKNNCYPTQ